LLIVVTAGATAVGGGDITLFVEFEVDVVVLLLVESVTMGSACANPEMYESITKSPSETSLLFMFNPFWIKK
jgi:hypothetical protein